MVVDFVSNTFLTLEYKENGFGGSYHQLVDEYPNCVLVVLLDLDTHWTSVYFY